MGHHLPDYVLTDTWVDLTTLPAYSSIANVAITIQAQFVKQAYVWVGGNDAPTAGNQGSLLTTGLSISSTSDHWWVKGYNDGDVPGTLGRLSILVET